MPPNGGGALTSLELANMAQTGSIKKFYENKGFGFVEPDDGSEDVFVHVKDNPDLKGAQPCDQVAFDSAWGDRKSKYKGTNLTFMKDQGNAQDAEWGSDAAQDQGNAEGCERGLHDEGEWTDHAGSSHADGWDYEAWQEERDEQQQWWWR